LHVYKQVPQFAPLLVDAKALLPTMRELLRTAASPVTIVAPAEIVEAPLNELDAHT
jgi:hypothetical protein